MILDCPSLDPDESNYYLDKAGTGLSHRSQEFPKTPVTHEFLTVASTILKFDAVKIWPARDRVFRPVLVYFLCTLFSKKISKKFEAVIGSENSTYASVFHASLAASNTSPTPHELKRVKY